MKLNDFGLQPFLNILDGWSYLHTAKQELAVLSYFACAV